MRRARAGAGRGGCGVTAPTTAAPDRNAEPDELIQRDLLAELCELVERADGTMQPYGVPTTEQELRSVAERHSKDRLLAAITVPLAPGLHLEEHW